MYAGRVQSDRHTRRAQERRVSHRLRARLLDVGDAEVKNVRRLQDPSPDEQLGASQTCELDHVVPLEIGGADTLDNIWPQCGPKNVVLAKRG